MLEIDVGWVNGNYQQILFHSVRTASADRALPSFAIHGSPAPQTRFSLVVVRPRRVDSEMLTARQRPYLLFGATWVVLLAYVWGCYCEKIRPLWGCYCENLAIGVGVLLR